jgi:hypothetical protein
MESILAAPDRGFHSTASGGSKLPGIGTDAASLLDRLFDNAQRYSYFVVS